MFPIVSYTSGLWQEKYIFIINMPQASHSFNQYSDNITIDTRSVHVRVLNARNGDMSS